MTKPIQELKYTFITEDGSQSLLLSDYHTKESLMEKIGLITTPSDGRSTVFAGTTIISYPTEMLEKDQNKQKLMHELDDMVRKNSLKYFVPQTEAVRLFLNDRDHNLKGMIAPNGTGKSVCGWIDTLLDIVPCDPGWPIFTTSGVEFRKYKGPKTLGGVGIVSYEWNNHITTIWPQIVKRWTPQDFLGEYGDNGNSSINWKNCPKIEICGTPVWFLACSQAQTVFESSAMDIYWWDEQGEEDKFNGANMRIRRRNGRHVFTLTPHRLPGRPDTGAGSWIHKMFNGESTAGLKPKFYTMDLKDIPDWIYSEQAKKDATEEWINEPTRIGNIKKLREGRSRIFGEFHESSGLVFDEWDRGKHIIQPFDVPSDWTKYRGIDHGRVEPTACLWAAVNPTGDVFVYREYYEKDRVVSENTTAIIKASGNIRALVDRPYDQKGEFYEVYEELQKSEVFLRTVLDSRSFGKKTDESQFTIGQIYRNNGINAKPANGNPPAIMVNTVKEYLRLDPSRKHYETGEFGAPRIYFFSNLRWTLWELEQYINEVTIRRDRQGNQSTSEKPRSKDDHLMSALMFLCMEKLSYMPSELYSDVDLVTNNEITRVTDPFTGY